MAKVKATRRDRPPRPPRPRVDAIRSLAPVIDIDGPRVRVGILWAAAATGALVVGPLALGAAMAATAASAAAQTCSSWRASSRRPSRTAAIVPAALLPLGAAFGFASLAAAILVGAGAAVLLWRQDLVFVRRRAAASGIAVAVPDLRHSVLIGFACGAAAAAPVLLAHERTGPVAFVLLAYAFVFDASAYLIGSGARSRWEGPAAGVTAIGSVTIAVAALLVPPFRGFTPVILGALAMLTAPIGPLVATLLLGDRSAPAPALRRLDVLFVLGPLWTAVALAILDNPPTA